MNAKSEDLPFTQSFTAFGRKAWNVKGWLHTAVYVSLIDKLQVASYKILVTGLKIPVTGNQQQIGKTTP